MNELITKMRCPMGCVNPIFTQSTRIVQENSNLILEGATTVKINSYTCQCCGSKFDLRESKSSNGRMIL